MKDDPKLKVVLKEFPVLGPGSVEAARVAVAVRMQDKTGKKYLDFHQKLLTGRGQVDKARALAAAKEAGLDVARIERDIASDEVKPDARGELQARREARAQRHAELRDRQQRRGRRGRPRQAQGKHQHRPLRQGDLLIAPLHAVRSRQSRVRYRPLPITIEIGRQIRRVMQVPSVPPSRCPRCVLALPCRRRRTGRRVRSSSSCRSVPAPASTSARG